MADSQPSTTAGDLSHSDWVRIHDHAARDYQIGEWTREVLLGARAHRRTLFSRAGGTVLDVACGYGLNFAYLPNATRLSGVDCSPVMLGMARDHVRTLGLAVALSEGDAEALDFEDDTFDTVISALSTCSFLHPIVALHEMRRVCKPAGRILLLEHGRSNWEWLARYQDRRAPRMRTQTGCQWNQEPQALVQAAGLTIVHAQRSFFGILHSIEASPAKSA